MAAHSDSTSPMPNSKQLENDPDYEEIYINHREKELEVIKQDAKEATIRKIGSVINSCFAQEIENKESELDMIQKNLMEAKLLMDHLRACIVTKFYHQEYFKGNEENESQDWLHPAAKDYSGKTPAYGRLADVRADHDYPKLLPDPLESGSHSRSSFQETEEPSKNITETTVRKNVKLVVGNISKYILSEERSSSQDQATHKWMIYVRPQDSHGEDNNLISRIVVFLHPSYKPNDLVEINKPPFCVCRRGWGEFPIRVQIHFHDSRNKPVDVIHQLKLDKTFTGLQTLGGETIVEVLLYISKDKSPAKASSKSNELSAVDQVSLNCSGSSSLPPNCISLSEDNLAMDIDVNHINKFNNNSTNSTSCELLWTKKPFMEESDSEIASVNNYEHLSSELTVSKAHVFNSSLDNRHTIDRGGDKEAEQQAFENVNHENDISVPSQIKDFDSRASSVNSNNSVTLLKNNQTFVKPEKKAEAYLRILSSVPIQITVKPKTAGLSCVNNEVVHFFKPNSDGVCLVPIHLLKCNVKNENLSDSAPVSWNLKAADCKQRLDRFIAHLRVGEYSSIHEIMLHLIKLYPLISADPSFPYCALSESQYDGWTIGKKLAAEWHRSREVQRALTRIIDAKEMAQKPWSVKEILKWARRYGFSQWTAPSTACFEEENEDEAIAGPNEVLGLTSSEQLLNSLTSRFNSEKEQVPNQPVENFDETVDVECIDKHIETFVKQDPDTSSEAVPNEERWLLKEVLMQVCKDVIADILHQSVGESSSRNNNQSSKSVTCADVYCAIQNLSFFDFLTNKNMGIEQL